MKRLRETLEEVLDDAGVKNTSAKPETRANIHIDTVNVEIMHIHVSNDPPHEEDD